MQVIRWADEFGLSEVWVAEHSTMRWEPIPSPELYLAVAAAQTSQIRPGGRHQHPGPPQPGGALACRLMQLDMMSQGRLMVGLSAGAYKTDQQLHGNDNPMERMHHAITEVEREAFADLNDAELAILHQLLARVRTRNGACAED